MSKVTTPEFRVSYPALLKPRQVPIKDAAGAIIGSKEEYGVMAIFDFGKDDPRLLPMKQLIEAAAKKKWGQDPKQWPPNLKIPIRDQGERAKFDKGVRTLAEGLTEGLVFITLKSKNRPGVVGPDVQPIIDETQIYAGCYGRASITAYDYDVNGNRGIALGLSNFQKTRDGDPLGGRSTPESDFAPVEGAGTASTTSSLFN